MSDEDKKAEQAMAYLTAQCAVNGVASLRYDDGQMFMFSRSIVEKLTNEMNTAGKDEIIVFVKSGKEFKVE